MGVIVDTCIWIDVERGSISPADVARYTGEEPVFLSPVSIAELAFGTEIAPSQALRQKRLAALNRLKKKPTLVIDEETGAIFGSIAAQLRRRGRGVDFRVQDVWIASQAVQHGHRLLPRNPAVFGARLPKG